MPRSPQPMAFYDEEIATAWHRATQYAGPAGRIATLPDIIEARLATTTNDAPWKTSYLTTSAEYYGIGADGRRKLIVAHGVGPLSAIEEVTRAYSGRHSTHSACYTGPISANEFLQLEAGHYGSVQVLRLSGPPVRENVLIIDLEEYLSFWEHVPGGWRTGFTAPLDLLARARLGVRASNYISLHAKYALDWHTTQSVRLPSDGTPIIICNKGSSDFPYGIRARIDGNFDTFRLVPQPLRQGTAMAHLLHAQHLVQMHYGDQEGLVTELSCYDGSYPIRFVGVPAGSTWQNGIAESP